MNIEEAIEELKKDIAHPTAKYTPDLQKAERLGIEALEKVKAVREGREWVGIGLLPSETEEIKE